VAAPDRLAASFQAFSFFAAVCSKPAPYSVDSDIDFWDFVVRSEWPVVVAGGLWAFREQIKRKLESTTEASGLGMSLKFAEKSAHQAEDELKKEVQALKADPAAKADAQLTARAEKIHAALEKFAAANNAIVEIRRPRIFQEHLQDGIKVK
jgi:hypothetical protein